MLKWLAPILIALGVFSLAGCDSSGGNSYTPPATTPVTVTLNRAQYVQQVTVYHYVGGNQWTSIFSRDFNNQDPITIDLELVTGDQYRVDAEVYDPADNSTHLASQTFTAGNGSSETYSEPSYRSRSVSGSQNVVIDVSRMPVKK